MRDAPAPDLPPPTLGTVTFTCRGTVTNAHDGDTVWMDYVELPIFLRSYPPSGTHWLIRLAGVAARELTQPDGQPDQGGAAARDNLAGMLLGRRVWMQTVKPDHYGNRLDAYLITEDGASVNDRLVADGWVLPWDGRGVQPKPVWPRVPRQSVMGYERATRTWRRPVA